MSKSKTNRQSIEELTERYQALHKAKIETETNLKNAREDLAALQRDAESEFGTSDLNELKAMLQALEEENERQRAEYQSSLEKIEADLQAVEADVARGNQPQDP
jgi:hypothetical protein